MRLKETMRKFWVYSRRHSVHHHWAGRVRKGWGSGRAACGRENSSFLKLWHFSLSHLKRNEHWRWMASTEMGLRLFEDNSKLSSVQSINADAMGCRDAATWFCLAKSNTKHQLSSCISTGPSGEHQHTHTYARRCPRVSLPPAPTQLINCFYWEIRSSMQKQWSSKKTENKSGGFTLEMIKIKKKYIPNTPEKLPFSWFLLYVDSDVPQPTISKSGDALKKPPDFKYNTFKDFIYLLTLELPGSIFWGCILQHVLKIKMNSLV